MIVKMSIGATEEQIGHVVERIKDCGYRSQLIQGIERTVIGVVGNSNLRRNELEALVAAPGVEEIIPVAHPFKLVSREFRREPSPERALSDGPQSLDFLGFAELMRGLAQPRVQAAAGAHS